MRLFGLVSLGLVLACAAMAGGAIHTHRQARILLENLKRLDTNSAHPRLSTRLERNTAISLRIRSVGTTFANMSLSSRIGFFRPFA